MTVRPYRTVAEIGPHLGAEQALRISLFTFSTGTCHKNGLFKRPFCLYEPEILPVPVEVGNSTRSSSSQYRPMTMHNTLSLNEIQQMRRYRTVSSVGPYRCMPQPGQR